MSQWLKLDLDYNVRKISYPSPILSLLVKTNAPCRFSAIAEHLVVY